MATKAKALPEVRQCTDPEDTLYGTSARKVAADRWICGNEHGGHWATDEEVKGWTVGTFKVEAA